MGNILHLSYFCPCIIAANKFGLLSLPPQRIPTYSNISIVFPWCSSACIWALGSWFVIFLCTGIFRWWKETLRSIQPKAARDSVTLFIGINFKGNPTRSVILKQAVWHLGFYTEFLQGFVWPLQKSSLPLEVCSAGKGFPSSIFPPTFCYCSQSRTEVRGEPVKLSLLK